MLETQPGKRVWICVTAALLAVIVLIGLAPTHTFQPHGIVLPLMKPRPPIPVNEVTFYPQAPLRYEKVGVLRIVLHYSSRMKNFQQEVLSYAKRLAAEVGANGVIIEGWGVSPTTVPTAQAIYQLEGWAIYVPMRPFNLNGE